MPFLMLNVEAFLNRSIKTALGFSSFLIISSLRIKNEKRIPLHRNYKLLLMITKFIISRLTLMGITLTEALFLSMSSLSLINSLTLNASIYENPMLVMKTYKFYLFILDFSMVSRTKRVKLKAVSNLEWHRKNRYKYNPSSTLFSNPYFISSIP